MSGLNEVASKVDFEMGRRNFQFFFEDICGFQLADFLTKNGMTMQKATPKPA